MKHNDGLKSVEQYIFVFFPFSPHFLLLDAFAELCSLQVDFCGEQHLFAARTVMLIHIKSEKKISTFDFNGPMTFFIVPPIDCL